MITQDSIREQLRGIVLEGFPQLNIKTQNKAEPKADPFEIMNLLENHISTMKELIENESKKMMVEFAKDACLSFDNTLRLFINYLKSPEDCLETSKLESLYSGLKSSFQTHYQGYFSSEYDKMDQIFFSMDSTFEELTNETHQLKKSLEKVSPSEPVSTADNSLAQPKTVEDKSGAQKEVPRAEENPLEEKKKEAGSGGLFNRLMSSFRRADDGYHKTDLGKDASGMRWDPVKKKWQFDDDPEEEEEEEVVKAPPTAEELAKKKAEKKAEEEAGNVPPKETSIVDNLIKPRGRTIGRAKTRQAGGVPRAPKMTAKIFDDMNEKASTFTFEQQRELIVCELQEKIKGVLVSLRDKEDESQDNQEVYMDYQNDVVNHTTSKMELLISQLYQKLLLNQKTEKSFTSSPPPKKEPISIQSTGINQGTQTSNCKDEKLQKLQREFDLYKKQTEVQKNLCEEEQRISKNNLEKQASFIQNIIQNTLKDAKESQLSQIESNSEGSSFLSLQDTQAVVDQFKRLTDIIKNQAAVLKKETHKVDQLTTGVNLLMRENERKGQFILQIQGKFKERQSKLYSLRKQLEVITSEKDLLKELVKRLTQLYKQLEAEKKYSDLSVGRIFDGLIKQGEQELTRNNVLLEAISRADQQTENSEAYYKSLLKQISQSKHDALAKSENEFQDLINKLYIQVSQNARAWAEGISGQTKQEIEKYVQKEAQLIESLRKAELEAEQNSSTIQQLEKEISQAQDTINQNSQQTQEQQQEIERLQKELQQAQENEQETKTKNISLEEQSQLSEKRFLEIEAKLASLELEAVESAREKENEGLAALETEALLTAKISNLEEELQQSKELTASLKKENNENTDLKILQEKTEQDKQAYQEQWDKIWDLINASKEKFNLTELSTSHEELSDQNDAAKTLESIFQKLEGTILEKETLIKTSQDEAEAKIEQETTQKESISSLQETIKSLEDQIEELKNDLANKNEVSEAEFTTIVKPTEGEEPVQNENILEDSPKDLLEEKPNQMNEDKQKEESFTEEHETTQTTDKQINTESVSSDELESLKQHIEELNAKIRDLEGEKEGSNALLETKIIELEKKVEESVSSTTDFDSQISQLKEQHIKELEEITVLKTEQKDCIDALESKIEDLKVEKESLVCKTAASDQKVTELTSEVVSLQDKLAQAEKTLELKETLVKDLQETAQGSAESDSNNQASHLVQVSELKEELSEKEFALNSLTKDLEEKTTQLEASQSDLNNLQTELDQKKEALAELEEKYQEAEENLKQTQEKHQEAEEKLQEAEEKLLEAEEKQKQEVVEVEPLKQSTSNDVIPFEEEGEDSHSAQQKVIALLRLDLADANRAIEEFRLEKEDLKEKVLNEIKTKADTSPEAQELLAALFGGNKEV